MSKKRTITILSLLIIAAIVILTVVFFLKRPGAKKIYDGDFSDMKIGIIYDSEPNYRNTFNLSHQRGLKKTQQDLGLKDSQIISRENVWADDEKAVSAAVEEMIEKGCNLIIASNGGYTGAFTEFAEKYPDIVFALALGSVSNGKNLVTCNVRIHEASYLTGIVAGKNTKTNHIGFVSSFGKDDPFVTSGLSAFAIGVEKVNPEATIELYSIGAYMESLRESIATEYLIGKNCDIISQNVDTPSPQIAAAHAGVAGIGSDIDMSEVSPDSVLTSVVWNWDVYYTWLIRSIHDKTFAGENYEGGIADGLISVTEPVAKSSPGTLEAFKTAKEGLVDGSLKIFSGVLETNEGTAVGASGKDFSDEEISTGINWYYKNIIEAGYRLDSNEFNQTSDSVLQLAVQPSSAFMPIFVARANGWIEEAMAPYGISVQWSDYESGPPMNAFFASGSGHIGVAGDVPVVSAIADGQENAFVASIGAGASYCIIVPAQSKISTVADLKGKKVGTVVGSTSHNVLKKFLESANLSLSDIEFVQIAGSEAPLALADGTCDAISIWEPMATSLAYAGNARILCDGSDIDFPGVNVIFARRSYLEENPEIVKEVLKQFYRGAKELKENPKQCARQISSYFNQDPEVLSSIIDKYDYKMVFSDADVDSLQDTVAFQLEMGNIRNGIYVKNYVDDSLAREVVEEYQNSLTTSDTKEMP